MPEITIEQSTFERLQRHAEPLLDTTDNVIHRALDALEQPQDESGGGDDDMLTIDPESLPDVTHAKVLNASLAGESVPKPTWKGLLDRMLIVAMTKLRNADELERLCQSNGINVVQGRKEDEGYHHLPEIDVSVQGQSAKKACNALVLLTKSLGVGLDIRFMWRPSKEKALHPGKKARLHMPGTP